MLLHRRLYEAYFSARKNKRKKPEQMQFELNYETELFNLYQDIMERKYQPLPTRVFVTHRPVDREIFAPRFRDRVVHHLIYHYIYHFFDSKFIYDSYSCRVGRGTLFGIERAKKFLRQVSHNYTQDAYVLKLDIQGYFMNINRELLYHRLEDQLDYQALGITKTEQDALRYLIKIVALHDASVDAERCSSISKWNNIPPSKSLFCTAQSCGLPIGSLTSQLFSNVYMDKIDHLIKSRFRYYGRYVDDLLLMDADKQKLLSAIPEIATWLGDMALCLHPKKTYLQHYSKGFYFLGQYIKPGRAYISNRTKKYIYKMMGEVNEQCHNRSSLSPEELSEICSRLNSYFGILAKAETYTYTTKIVAQLPTLLSVYADIGYSIHKQQMYMNIKPEYRMKNKYAEYY